MKIQRKAINTTSAAIAIVLVVVIIGAIAYIASSSGKNTTVTLTTTSTSVSTSVSTASVSSTGAVNCGTSSVTLNGAGSTLVTPLMSSWTFAYGQLCTNVGVNYASVGSGAGIGQITAPTVNFGASDAPLSSSQYAALKSNLGPLLTIPESASGVVPAYNLPGIATNLKFTGAVLAKIFLGNITMWNDPALTALNPGVTLPAHAITVIHRSDGSGTMYAFTNYLSDSSTFWAQHVGYATLVNWPTGLGCKGNEGVAGCISNNQYAIGPLEIAYEITNKGLISYGSVQNAAGNFVLANLTNIAAAVSIGASSGLPPASGIWTPVSIINSIFNDTAATNVYPITTFTYLLVYQQQTDQSHGAALVNFLWWVVNSAQSGGASLGYVPLPANVVTLDNTAINTITYNGTPLHAGA